MGPAVCLCDGGCAYGRMGTASRLMSEGQGWLGVPDGSVVVVDGSIVM